MGMIGQNEMAMGGIEARPAQAAVAAVAAPDLQARRDLAARRTHAELRGFNALDLQPPGAVFDLPIADQNMRHEAHNAFDHLGNQARIEALRDVILVLSARSCHGRTLLFLDLSEFFSARLRLRAGAR